MARTIPHALSRQPLQTCSRASKRNYFRLYLHYMYFNIARTFYLQADNIFAFIVLAPTIVAARITFGLMQQILNAFDQVRASFQYLVNSWTTIIELLSIYKRLRGGLDTVIEDQLMLASTSASSARPPYLGKVRR